MASELVEKVATIIRGGLRDDGTSHEKARAAIKAVAEWIDNNSLREEGGHIYADGFLITRKLLAKLEDKTP